MQIICIAIGGLGQNVFFVISPNVFYFNEWDFCIFAKHQQILQ